MERMIHQADDRAGESTNTGVSYPKTVSQITAEVLC
jgi:hypothetical protein